MAGPEITDNPAKSHHHPTRCGLNLPHPPALMKLMEGISDMLFLLSLAHCHCRLFNGVAADVGWRDQTLVFPCLCLGYFREFILRNEHKKKSKI